MARPSPGVTLWFTGLSGAGKSTLARAVGARLEALGRTVEYLDGDEVRTHLSKGLGFSREDRDTNVERIGWVASRLTRLGAVVVVAAISPYAQARSTARALVEAHGRFVEIHVDTPLATCEARDPKGLYKRARRGELRSFTGLDDPYEVPKSPELRIDTTTLSVETAVEKILNHVLAATEAVVSAAS